MKAIFERINTAGTNSFIFRQFEVPAFDAPYHFHPEYELTLISKGEGQRYVGQHVADFWEGDLVFIGANLPHCWINRPLEAENVSAIVIQFNEHFWGELFINLPEMEPIKHFLKQSKVGFRIIGQTQVALAAKIKALVPEKPLSKMVGLIEILDILSQSNDLQALDFSFSEHHYSQVETARFQKVFSYLIANFREDLTLEQIAQVADLTPTSFCRYFKDITQKTFIEVLNEYRLQYACHLLQKSDLPVQQIAFDSGFGDVPYFNKVFKKQKSCTPLAYRKATKA
ncbi:MAG: AraC family transcriptional regulator [Spirosomataceae bacterium]